MPLALGVTSRTTIPFPSGCPGNVTFTTTALPVTLFSVVSETTGLAFAHCNPFGVALLGVPCGVAGDGLPGVGLFFTHSRVWVAFNGDALGFEYW